MTVKTVIEDGRIASVDVVENHETQAIAAGALESIPQRIVEANDATVDVVAGASLTSGRIMKAVAECLSHAQESRGLGDVYKRQRVPEPGGEVMQSIMMLSMKFQNSSGAIRSVFCTIGNCAKNRAVSIERLGFAKRFESGSGHSPLFVQ